MVKPTSYAILEHIHNRIPISKQDPPIVSIRAPVPSVVEREHRRQEREDGLPFIITGDAEVDGVFFGVAFRGEAHAALWGLA